MILSIFDMYEEGQFNSKKPVYKLYLNMYLYIYIYISTQFFFG